MNWALATRLHQFLLIHAAVVERDGSAVALVGPPGTGKSTLCAALVSTRGWRLLSDEFLILDPRTGAAHPLPRPIALKDESIGVLSGLVPSAMTGSFYAGTPKGVLAYLSAPKDSLSRQTEAVPPGVVVFPRFQRGAVVTPSSVPRTRAFLRLADNAFNFAVRGRAGFEELVRIVETCVCWDLVFGDVQEAASFVERTAADAAKSRQLAAPR
jgi:HprK-related kinase A